MLKSYTAFFNSVIVDLDIEEQREYDLIQPLKSEFNKKYYENPAKELELGLSAIRHLFHILKGSETINQAGL